MKNLLLGVLLVFVAGAADDPNRLSQDEARRYARVCVGQVGTLADAQLTTSVLPAKACATRGEGGGAMIVPDQKLSAAKFARMGKKVIPVGQLWFRKWTAAIKRKGVPKKKLRMVTINVDDKDRPMALFLLGVRQNKKKTLELLVYAQGNDPLLVLPLAKYGRDQDLPVVLEWARGEKDVDSLSLYLAGKYQAIIPITRMNK